MRGEPAGDLLAMRRTDVVTHQMNRPDVLGNLLGHVCQEGDAVLLPCACIPLAIDPTGTGIESRTEVEGSGACILMFILVGPVLRLGWPGRGQPRTRPQRSLLVPRAAHLSVAEWTRVEIDEGGAGGIQCGIPGGCGLPPAVLTPGCQVRRGQDAAHGRRGKLRHEPVREELPRPFGTIPRGEATAEPIGAFTGQAYHVNGDRRGKTHPWRRGRGRP